MQYLNEDVYVAGLKLRADGDYDYENRKLRRLSNNVLDMRHMKTCTLIFDSAIRDHTPFVLVLGGIEARFRRVALPFALRFLKTATGLLKD